MGESPDLGFGVLSSDRDLEVKLVKRLVARRGADDDPTGQRVLRARRASRRASQWGGSIAQSLCRVAAGADFVVQA